jgi:hypothetical protein
MSVNNVFELMCAQAEYIKRVRKAHDEVLSLFEEYQSEMITLLFDQAGALTRPLTSDDNET